MLIHKYEENTVGIDYVVGDVHGCFTVLQNMLDRIGFDPTKDRLFILGDLVDRGPESHLVREWLAKPWVISLMGNHEDMAIDYHLEPNKTALYEQDYRGNGGAWNIEGSYAQTAAVAKAFSDLPVAIEYRKKDGTRIGMVHADCPFNEWDKFESVISNPTDGWFTYAYTNAMWDRRRPQGERRDSIRGVDYVLVGHTPMPRPTMINNVVYLDTGAVFRGDGYFTMLRMSDMSLISETGSFPYMTDSGYIEDIQGKIPLSEIVGDDVILSDGSWYACYYEHTKQFFRTVKVVSDCGGPDILVYDAKGYRVDLMAKAGVDFYELSVPSRQNFA